MNAMTFDEQPLLALESILIRADTMSGTIPADLPNLRELVIRCEGELEL